MSEQWVGMSGFDEYQVSDLGRVRSVASGKILKPSAGSVSLFRDRRPTRRSLRRLLTEAFGAEHAIAILGPRGSLLARGPTPEVVNLIRTLWTQGATLTNISRGTGMSRQYVHNITSGKRWAESPLPRKRPAEGARP